MNSMQKEIEIREHLEEIGYTVYYVEVWVRDTEVFLDIEYGGSPNKYNHIHGVCSLEEATAIINRIMRLRK